MRQFRNLVKPYLLWSFVIIIVPLFLIALYAVTTGGNTLVNIQFTLDNFKKASEDIYIQVFIRSLKIGLLTTGICFLLGYPMAYMITKFSERVQNLLILGVTIPMWINLLLRTYAWTSLLSDNGLLNALLIKLGLPTVSLMYTDFAVLLGLVVNYLPFMVIPIHTSLAKMDASLLEAAADLGANRLRVFTRVIFKLSLPGVINGIIMTFLLAISAFVVPRILGGGSYMLIGNLIEQQFIHVGNWNIGSAVSLVLAVIILLSIRYLRKIDPDDQEKEE